MVKRKLRYNVRTDLGDQTYFKHRWTVALISDLREIDRIKERILIQLAPLDDFCLNYEKPLEGSHGLHCRIFSFSSTCGQFTDISKIYNSPDFKKDRNLRDTNDVGLEAYVSKLCED